MTQHLVDRAEITDLVYRLGACLDEHRFDELRDLLVDDVMASTPGGTAQGKDAVVAQATGNHADFAGLQHLVTGVLVELDGDRASVRANIVGAFSRGAGQPERVLGGVYRFGVVRTAQGWRFGRIEVRPVWLVDSPAA